MSGADVKSSSPAARLRAQVKESLEAEYLRLQAADRPALLEALADAPPAHTPDTALVEDELALLDRRIASIRAYLDSVPGGTNGGRPAVGRCVRVDLGDGPRWMLLADLPVLDDRVVAADSPLGRVLRATDVGSAFAYLSPTGPRAGTLLGVESDADARETVGPDDRAPAPPAARPLAVLERAEALALLRAKSGGVGRLAFTLFGRAHLSVVNFLVDGDEVIFRIDPGTTLSAVGFGGHFVFEVDEIDWTARTGWSVTVTGPVQQVGAPDLQRLLTRLDSWAAGERRHVVRLKPRTVVGRALVADA